MISAIYTNKPPTMELVPGSHKENGPLDCLASNFEPISLNEMDAVQLMNRTDTKFIINKAQLLRLLAEATQQYYIVEIDNKRILPYSSVYFDTIDNSMYHLHHNGKLSRHKIRMRSYLNSGISFLEIKSKNNKGRTHKRRIEIDQTNFKSMSFNKRELNFIRELLPYDPNGLKPQLQNHFQRITLVDKLKTERVTIDLNIHFRCMINNSSESLQDLVIVEMKQDGNCKSCFRKLLNEYGILPGSMSKYCLGMVLLHSDIKYNRFKNKLRKINKITDNSHAIIY